MADFRSFDLKNFKKKIVKYLQIAKNNGIIRILNNVLLLRVVRHSQYCYVGEIFLEEFGMKVKSVEEIKNVLLPIAEEMDIEIVEVEFKQGREPSLTVFIDAAR